MKLGKLELMHDDLVESINRKWAFLEAMVSAGESKSNDVKPSDNVSLSKGEDILSKILAQYEKLTDVSFYIIDIKSKIQIPELGMTIQTAENKLSILRAQLFYYERLQKMTIEQGFVVTGMDDTLKTQEIVLDKGFDVPSILESVDYLRNEVTKYDSYIQKILWETEVVAPGLEDMKLTDSLLVHTQAQAGTPKSSQTVDPEEYRPAKEVVNVDEYVPAGKYVADKIYESCPICNSPHRTNIEYIYGNSKQNIQEALNYVAYHCDMPEIQPNVLTNHLDTHLEVGSTAKEK